MEELIDALPRSTRSGFFAEVAWDEAGLLASQTAMRAVDRQFYAPALAERPYASICHTIGSNGYERVTMSKPIVHAFFLHELWRWLQDRGHDVDDATKGSLVDVLDVGSGTGYLTVAMARLLEQQGIVGQVLGIDITDDLVSLGLRNLEADFSSRDLVSRLCFRCEDAHRAPGAADADRFAFVAVSAAADASSHGPGGAASGVPPGLLKRLRPGGRLIVPVSGADGEQHFVRVDRSIDGSFLEPVHLCEARFVSLIRTTKIGL